MATRSSVSIFTNQFFTEDMKIDFMKQVDIPKGWEKDGSGMTTYAANIYDPREDVYNFMRALSDYMEENALTSYAEVSLYRNYNELGFGVRRDAVLFEFEENIYPDEPSVPFPQDESDFDWKTDRKEIHQVIIDRKAERNEPKHISDVLGKVMADLQSKIDEKGLSSETLETEGVDVSEDTPRL